MFWAWGFQLSPSKNHWKNIKKSKTSKNILNLRWKSYFIHAYKIWSRCDLQALRKKIHNLLHFLKIYQMNPTIYNGMNSLWRDRLILGSNPVKILHHRLSSTRCNFFHRSRSPIRVYIFEKYSSRSLHFRCLFDETSNPGRSKTGMKFIEFRKIPESRFSQPHLREAYRGWPDRIW